MDWVETFILQFIEPVYTVVFLLAPNEMVKYKYINIKIKHIQ